MTTSAMATRRDEPGPIAALDGSKRLVLSGAQTERIAAALSAHFTCLFRVARRLGLPEAIAEEAVQDAFIVFAQRIECVALGKERAFLLGTVTRITSNLRRSAWARHEVPCEPSWLDTECQQPTQGALLEQKRAREHLDRLLSTLASDLREVFVLFEIEQLTMTEIAETLGIKLGTVGSRLHRARHEFDRAKHTLSKGTNRRRGSDD